MRIKPANEIFIGETALKPQSQTIRGEYIHMRGEVFYKIENFDAMDPFFMSIVSSSNHWLFIASTGGLTAGRINSDHALFPYYTVDKLTENFENTGHKAIFLVHAPGRTSLWEPLSDRYQGAYHLQRNLYKNTAGSVVIFEEINHSLELAYTCAWQTGDQYGFVKTSTLRNTGQQNCHIRLLDGLQNILPANVSAQTQNVFGPLLDAYKRSELDAQSGMGIFALNSTLTDLAEPSESLLATTVIQLGLDPLNYLLSSDQLDAFRAGEEIHSETETRGKRGAYFVHASFDLPSGSEQSWHLVAEVDQHAAAIVHLKNAFLTNRNGLVQAVMHDAARNTTNLHKIVVMADGLQVSSRSLHNAHHFANVMFNAMRGGIFEDQYWLDTRDFSDFVRVRNRRALAENAAWFAQLPEKIRIADLLNLASTSRSPDLIRCASAYLPLSFSRRHGDPSRPWNRFSIDIKKPDGTKQLNYEGNWRDIFQNWEALAFAYPDYLESMICTFLNATTVDGYNPYRITRDGIDWEIPEPNNPWANIGYWSDHQLIYLLKLLEISTRLHPARLETFLDRPVFSYANVPYRIKPYDSILKDPFNTIDFDWDLQKTIQKRTAEIGADGKLVLSPDGQIALASLAEKLLTLLLAKMVNFVPEGGIWMNTQRPEWNDANNALVGKGISVVTLCYLRRAVVFIHDLLENSSLDTLHIRAEVRRLFDALGQVLTANQARLNGKFNPQQRRAMMDALGLAGSDYRSTCYTRGLSADFVELSVQDMCAFLELAQKYIDHTLQANRRPDNLFHAYNILHLSEDAASISYLYEMLEGQVAVLSSGLLTGEESLALLESMRRGPLYRADQQTYILYPDRVLPGFLERNTLTSAQVSGIRLVAELEGDNNTSLFVRDENGSYHFHGSIRNVKGVQQILQVLGQESKYAAFVQAESAAIEDLFEQVFHHDQFTGRSGTFFAYEGLGSIYWHMVSKLLLAVQETILRVRDEPAAQKLIQKYHDIRQGQCFNKKPQQYGAFATDPYSHTPKDQGAKQPGMTGMVKEEILARLTELGLFIQAGRLVFDFLLFDRRELLTAEATFAYWDVNDQPRQINLHPGSLAYTFCQVPVILQAAEESSIAVYRSDGEMRKIPGHSLDAEHSRHILQRDGVVDHLLVSIPFED